MIKKFVINIVKENIFEVNDVLFYNTGENTQYNKKQNKTKNINKIIIMCSVYLSR